MKNILVLGAGRSSTVLIKYLFDNAAANDWIITVADVSIELSKQKTKGYSGARAIAFDVNDPEQRTREISCADLVISMLPASMHAPVAKDCVVLQKHLITASYVSPEIKLLDEDAKKAGVLLLNEIGVDPGIDHMIAMQEIESIRANGAELLRFESFTGGLLAPESDNNPWNYKFTLQGREQP
jgi:saccharopine dehydrogenase-like NADP-dependent oxidoreductase